MVNVLRSCPAGIMALIKKNLIRINTYSNYSQSNVEWHCSTRNDVHIFNFRLCAY